MKRILFLPLLALTLPAADLVTTKSLGKLKSSDVVLIQRNRKGERRQTTTVVSTTGDKYTTESAFFEWTYSAGVLSLSFGGAIPTEHFLVPVEGGRLVVTVVNADTSFFTVGADSLTQYFPNVLSGWSIVTTEVYSTGLAMLPMDEAGYIKFSQVLP